MDVRSVMPSPVGKLTLVASEAGLAAIVWHGEHDPGRGADARRGADAVRGLDAEVLPGADCEAAGAPHSILSQTRHQLDGYFRGERTVFDLPLDLRGSAFDKSVWAALLRIPFGTTRSYGEMARELGDPNRMRAVGAANGRNPIPIVVPCHRVIGAAGDLVGFGGGLQRKIYLLDLERGALRLPLST